MKRGRTFYIYGAYGSAAKAKRKHKRIKGTFVRKRKVRGDVRWIVLKPRKRR